MLWELALQEGQPIGLRFLDEATRDPNAQRRLRARSEPALIAAVGLDAGARDCASRLLTERLGDSVYPLRSKAEMAFVAMELEDRVGPASEECAGIIVQALAEDLPEDSRMSWRNHLIDASARLEPVTAAGLVVAAMEREKEATACSQLALALANVAPRLDPAEAARFCGRAARILAIGPAGEESGE